MLPRSSADILAAAKRPPTKATRKQRAKPQPPQPPPSYSTQMTTFSVTDSIEPTSPISQLRSFVESSHSIGGVIFEPIVTQDYLKDSPTAVDLNEGETCSYDCDEETTLEFLFSFFTI